MSSWPMQSPLTGRADDRSEVVSKRCRSPNEKYKTYVRSLKDTSRVNMSVVQCARVVGTRLRLYMAWGFLVSAVHFCGTENKFAFCMHRRRCFRWRAGTIMSSDLESLKVSLWIGDDGWFCSAPHTKRYWQKCWHFKRLKLTRLFSRAACAGGASDTQEDWRNCWQVRHSRCPTRYGLVSEVCEWGGLLKRTPVSL